MHRLNHLRLVRIGGADRLSFLQGQLTQDLDCHSGTSKVFRLKK